MSDAVDHAVVVRLCRVQARGMVSVASVVVLGWLLVVADVDRRTGRIPNAAVLPAVAGTAAVALVVPMVGVGAVVLALPYAVAFALRACGGGDVKLAVPCGGLLADPGAALGAVLLAAVITVVGMVLTRRRRAPHGPALAVATVSLLSL